MAPAAVDEKRQQKRFIRNFEKVHRIGSKCYPSDLYFHLLRSHTVALGFFWLSWWFLSGAIIAGMFWSTRRENVDFMTAPSGEPVETFAQFFNVVLLFIIDASSPYVWGDRMNVVLCVAGIWKMITLAAFISVFLDRLQSPRARLRWSARALVTVIDGQPVFVFRVANEKASILTDAEMKLHVMSTYVTKEGWRGRRAVELPLVRASIPLLSLSWQLVHVIDRDSPLLPYLPLLGVPAADSCVACTPGEDTLTSQTGRLGGQIDSSVEEIEVMCFFSGEDATQHETLKSWKIYSFDEVAIGGRFADVIHFPSTANLSLGNSHSHAFAREAPIPPWWHALLPSRWFGGEPTFTLDLRVFDKVVPLPASATSKRGSGTSASAGPAVDIAVAVDASGTGSFESVGETGSSRDATA